MCHHSTAYQGAPEENHRCLLELVTAQDPTALGDLYKDTHAMAFSIAHSILHNREAAEEAVQDAYLQIWRQADHFDPERGSPLAWIVTIVRSRSLDRRRRLAREHAVDHQEEECKDPAANDTERISLRLEATRLVRSALRRLRVEERTLIEHAYYGGLSHREMAKHMQIPLGTIKTRIRSAIHRLRKSLQPYKLADLLD